MGIFSRNRLSEQGQRNFDLGNIYLERNDFEKALKQFNKALETDPKSNLISDALNTLKEKIKSQRNEIDTKKMMILYTANSINTDLINWYFENDYIIFSIGYGNKNWTICFLKNLASIKQKIFITPEIPSLQIQSGWQDRFYLTHACYGQNLWLIVTQSIERVGDQKWFYNSDFPSEEINALYQSGYQISVCDYGDAWFVVLDENSNYKHQDFDFFDEYPEDEFEIIWEQERYINRLLYNGEEWLIIHSNCANWDQQGLLNEKKFPFSNLEKEYNESGAVPTSIAFDGTYWNIIYTSMIDPKEEDENELDEDELKNLSIEQALKELNNLVGLKNVKEEINNLISLINLNKIKLERGLNVYSFSLHMVFTGNPGTGKTTVARIIGKILRVLGILSKGHVIEVDRSGLVAEYIGQTAIKTNKVIDSALNGVLFIDEAYSLAKGENDFGQEAIETLLKRMEDERNRLVVIIAGYTEQMKDFIKSNPGLQSRFNTYLHFDDYDANDLENIFRQSLVKSELQLSSEADTFAKKYFSFLFKARDKYFGNARDIRNLIEDLIKIQSNRLSKEKDISDEQLRTITASDFQNAVKDFYKEEHEQTIEEIMVELNHLVGLEQIKQEVSALANFIKIEQLRKLKGLNSKNISLHSVFYGPPGTGKTTVARLMGKIFKALGFLARGQVGEVSRTNLVAEYVGQTAIKTNNVIDDAINGILFIDEAYSLNEGGNGNDFGKEAIETILKRMEDERDKLCVIIAGYTENMNRFIDSNPGLKSRFTNYFHFKNYTNHELVKIIKGFFIDDKFVLEEGCEELLEIFFGDCIISDENFGNAREARNLYEKIKLKQSIRLCKNPNPSLEELMLITTEDLQLALQEKL